MDIILVHLGGDIPQYLMCCINQIRKYTDDVVVLIVDRDVKMYDTKNILIININNLPMCHNHKMFLESNHFSKYGDLFWRYACERFYTIESVMNFLGIKKALHIENDNLIYGEPDYEWLENYCYDRVGLTQITPTLTGAGIMYIGDIRSLEEFNLRITSLVLTETRILQARYGNEMLNEMRLIDIIRTETVGLIKLLPTLPVSESKYIYDCASWGQYVGGTHQEPNKTYTSEDHIIGKKIIDGEYDCKFIGKKPYVEDAAKNIKPLFNLHIHSKQLE